MNEDVLFLSLPTPPEWLQQQLIELCSRITTSKERYARMQSLVHPGLPLAVQEYGNEQVPELSREAIDEIRNIYCNQFRGGVYGVIAKAENILGVPSVTPPHCDRHRQVAINYILQTGGDNVETSFYNETRRHYDLSAGENLNYNEVTEKSKICLPANQWHAFDAQRYHSVEGIESKRFYFSLALILNISWVDFKQEYKHLIIA